MATGGGIAALVAIPFILAGCIIPFVYYNDTSGGGPPSASVFDLGDPSGLWYALEPVAVMFLAATAAGFLIAWQNPTVRAVGAGVLLAFGLQTLALFIGYTAGDTSFGRIGLGGPMGTLGGALLIVGGALTAASFFAKPTSA